MIQLVNANALQIPLQDESVHMVVTSPPYYALRDYKTNGQLGLEKRADCLGWATGEKCGECYICQMVAVFGEVKRVLRSDGVCFLNIGDSYAGSSMNGGSQETRCGGGKKALQQVKIESSNVSVGIQDLKPKDMLLIPQRLALALQADGWWIRSEIIWHKPNPMPESVTDRPTKSHETIWLMSKSARYFWDAEGVREPNEPGTLIRYKPGERIPNHKKLGGSDRCTPEFLDGQVFQNNGRNLRDVWTIATQPYSGAHYATYPEALVEKCIKAGTSERGVCPKCGSQWVRVVERVSTGKRYATGKSDAKNKVGLVTTFSGYDDGSSALQFKTVGWQPSCTCDLPPVPAIVLDPFAGSGTTCLVAKRMGRSAIGLDLSYQYLRENAWERVQMNAPMMEI